VRDYVSAKKKPSSLFARANHTLKHVLSIIGGAFFPQSAAKKVLVFTEPGMFN
jgi:hypothetical protein